MEEVDYGGGHLELLLAAGLVLGLLLRHNRHIQPLLEVLQQLLAQLLAEDVAEELGQVGKPLDQVEVEVAVVAQVQQQLTHHLGRSGWRRKIFLLLNLF